MSRSDRRRHGRVLGEVNAVALTADELREFIDECQRRGGGRLDSFETLMFTAVRLAAGDPMRACAFAFRAQALSKLVGTFTQQGWTMSGPDGAVFDAPRLLAAAVAEPLIVRGDAEFAFDRARFMDNAVRLSEAGAQDR
jgi:hypothetical protein